MHATTTQTNATYSSARHHIATHYNTLQHTATRCNTPVKHYGGTLQSANNAHLQRTATHCHTLQHTATYCNTLRHAATHQSNNMAGLCRVQIMLASLYFCQPMLGGRSAAHGVWVWCVCVHVCVNRRTGRARERERETETKRDRKI